jgi:hypothetical protein
MYKAEKSWLGPNNKDDDCGIYVYEKTATLTMNFAYCFICFSIPVNDL